MNRLSDHPDAGQLRTQAKELKRALTEGEPEATRRVLESHPKFAGRPAERMDGWELTLRDAQVTIAREYGFDRWKDLVAEVEGKRVVRWGEENWSDAVGRAMALAHELGHDWVMGEHVLLGPAHSEAADGCLRRLERTRRELRRGAGDAEPDAGRQGE